jgi:hypothetical protein
MLIATGGATFQPGWATGKASPPPLFKSCLIRIQGLANEAALALSRTPHALGE